MDKWPAITAQRAKEIVEKLESKKYSKIYSKLNWDRESLLWSIYHAINDNANMGYCYLKFYVMFNFNDKMPIINEVVTELKEKGFTVKVLSDIDSLMIYWI